MDRLRRSIRQSFRRRSPKESSDDPSKPHQWQKDEASVRAGTCSFTVKYLGCVEVYESRGMQVCEEALKVLRNSRRRTIKGVLYVSGDGLRVVDAENKGLIVDQTIEKVSFCAPDRNQEKGFAYICRDGTTRRWMCHGFIASKDSGERLSHAVGCAFAVCLEQKQKRDREAQIIAQIQPAAIPTAAQQPASQVQSNALTIAETTSLHGSFRRASLQERKQDPQNIIHTEKPPVKPVSNPNSISRPAPNKSLFERQGSLRMPATTTTVESTKQDSFHRFNSLRLNQLPSNLTRQHQQQPQHSSNNAGVGAIWEGEETSSITDLSTTGSISGRTTNGFDSPSHTTNNAAGHLSRWDKSFVQGNTNLNNESSLSPASSTISTTSKSKAEEWLQVAANQARLLQQQNRGQTPPNSNAASSSFNSSPAPGGGDSSTSSPQHYAAYCNAIDFYPSTPAHQSSTQRPPLYHGGQNGTDSTTTAYHGPPPLNANRSVSSSVAAAGWHQSVSFDVADADNFEDKWASLDKRRNSTSNSNVTNPFAQESTTVQI